MGALGVGGRTVSDCGFGGACGREGGAVAAGTLFEHVFGFSPLLEGVVAAAEGGERDCQFSAVEEGAGQVDGGLVEDGGLTPADAIRAATMHGARTIGREKDMGSIENGKLANLVILDRDPLSNIHNLRSIYMTVKNGVGYRRRAYRTAAILPSRQ